MQNHEPQVIKQMLSDQDDLIIYAVMYRKHYLLHVVSMLFFCN